MLLTSEQDVATVGKALYAAQLMAEGYKKPNSAAAMKEAADAFRRIVASGEPPSEQEQEPGEAAGDADHVDVGFRLPRSVTWRGVSYSVSMSPEAFRFGLSGPSEAVALEYESLALDCKVQAEAARYLRGERDAGAATTGDDMRICRRCGRLDCLWRICRSSVRRVGAPRESEEGQP